MRRLLFGRSWRRSGDVIRERAVQIEKHREREKNSIPGHMGRRRNAEREYRIYSRGRTIRFRRTTETRRRVGVFGYVFEEERCGFCGCRFAKRRAGAGRRTDDFRSRIGVGERFLSLERLERRERLEAKLDVLGRARERRKRTVWDIRRTKRV